ncbi:MAG: LPS export ABC transporter permease LptF [Rhodobacteraceae bacterium]|nr:LPS export ABC transporter permease LptF [Paracoccaceae bacterium]
MSKFDTYVLRRLLLMFAFLALVLGAMYCINHAVKLLDRLIADGQSVLVFAEFLALSLPEIMQRVLPVSAFVATIYLTNRLIMDSELTILRAIGCDPWRLARPVVVFGVITAVGLAGITHFLAPASTTKLAERKHEVAQDIIGRFLNEGRFLHPARGITFYIREITADGTLRDIFLSDSRNADRVVSHTAAQARLQRLGDRLELRMEEGVSQLYERPTDRLFTTQFARFTYDVSSLLDARGRPRRDVDEYSTAELLRNATDGISAAGAVGVSLGHRLEEAHSRTSQPLMSFIAVLIGFAALVGGAYSRFGLWPRIVMAVVLLTLLQMLNNLLAGLVHSRAALWPLLYAPPAVGGAFAALLLGGAAYPLHWNYRRGRRRTEPESSGGTA